MDRYMFRGKRLDNGEWCFGAYFNGHFSALIFPEIRHTDSSDLYRVFAHEVDPQTIGQFTGKKADELVYDNDILHSGDWESDWVVFWNDEAAGWFCRNLNDLDEVEPLVDVLEADTWVAGNIHDNKNSGD